MKLPNAVEDAPIRFRMVLKLGTDNPVNKTMRTIVVLSNTLFHVNSTRNRISWCKVCAKRPVCCFLLYDSG